MRKRFVELSGGRIADHMLGIVVVAVNVEDLNTADASNVVRVVMEALEAHYPSQQRD